MESSPQDKARATDNGQSEEQNTKRGRGAPAYGNYPKATLEASLIIAGAIRDNNAGKPFNRLLLAQAINRTPSSSAFRSLITSSSKYGLTSGNYASALISLTELGRSVVFPRTDEEGQKALVQAAMNVDIFGKFYTHYDQNKLPRDEIGENVLRIDMGVPGGRLDECLALIKENGTFVGVIREVSGAPYVMVDAKGGPVQRVEVPTHETEDETEADEQPPPSAGPAAAAPSGEEARAPLRIFVSHSKGNDAILDQIKTVLEFGKYEYEIAEEEETSAIPVPEKILNAMRRCTAAIINVSADGVEKRSDGTYGINQNVLIEIGTAFILYEKRVVLLVDRRVSLPSNLQGLYRSAYEGDELSWNEGMKLQQAITHFGEQS